METEHCAWKRRSRLMSSRLEYDRLQETVPLGQWTQVNDLVCRSRCMAHQDRRARLQRRWLGAACAPPHQG